MGSCTIQNPLGVPRDLRIRPQVPYHGLKGSRGPAPTSGSQAPVRKLQLWPLRLPRGLCTHWRPHRCRGRIRLILPGSFLPHHKHTSLPSLCCQPHAVQTTARAQPGLPVRGRISQWKASSCLLSQPRLQPSPQGPRLKLQGPTAGAQTRGPSCVSTAILF